MACLYVDGALLIQTVLYFTIVCTGLATTISSARAKGEFGGYCVLYGSATCQLNETNWNCSASSGNPSICSFITGANIFISVFFAFAAGCYHAYAVHRSRIIIRVGSQMWIRSLLLGSILAFIITLVSACTITVGLSTWCGNFNNNSFTTTVLPTTTTTSMTTVNATVASTTTVNTSVSAVASFVNEVTSTNATTAVSWAGCTEKQSIVWSFPNDEMETTNRYYTNRYYYLFSVAESSCWVNVAIWLLQVIFYIRRLYKSLRQRQQNTYQDPFNTDDAFDIFN